MIMKTEISHRVSDMGIEVTRISVARPNRKLSAAMGGKQDVQESKKQIEKIQRSLCGSFIRPLRRRQANPNSTCAFTLDGTLSAQLLSTNRDRPHNLLDRSLVAR